MHRKISGLAAILCCGLLLAGCADDYTPKPRGFQRFVFDEKKYEPYSNDCGFSCELPDYAVVLPDFSTEQQKCWFNIYYKPFNATLHVSFNKLRNPGDLVKFSEDARTLVYKHTVKADEIYETYVHNDHLQGMVYELSGNTATSFQFFVTDSVRNYMRGALYFNERTNTDSVAPVLAYLEKDIYKMIETIRWK